MGPSLETVFIELRERLLKAAPTMRVKTDEPGNMVLTTQWTLPGKKEPEWFGAVQLKKNYVSWHLMPLYAAPAISDRIPSDLKKHMHGKSCFNFKKVEPELFDALEGLTRICVVAYTEPIVAKPH